MNGYDKNIDITIYIIEHKPNFNIYAIEGYELDIVDRIIYNGYIYFHYLLFNFIVFYQYIIFLKSNSKIIIWDIN